jgi:2,3-bisphosphoglycerate-dependent phosphoglycerate mutase
MRLILIRHGLPQRTEGTSDAPLSEVGHAQAVAMAEWLRHEPIDALYVSPMIRARQTVAPLEQRTGLVAKVLDGVAEFDRRGSRYVPIEELKQADRKAWQQTMSGNVVPEQDAFRQTVVEALLGVVARHPGQSIAVTCHGGVINVWASHVLGMTQPKMFFLPDYTSINRFLVSSAGHLTLESLNETGHLKGHRRP